MVHSLRKFFGTQLGISDVEDFHNEALMGHAVGLTAIYRVAPEKRFAQYLKAINNLTIKEENKLREQIKEKDEDEKELMDLRQEVYYNELEMNAMKEEIQKLKASPTNDSQENRIKQLENLVSQLLEKIK